MGTNSTEPPSLVTARRDAGNRSCKASFGEAHSIFSVITSLSLAQVTTRHSRPSSGSRFPISAIYSDRTNMPLTLVVWSARP